MRSDGFRPAADSNGDRQLLGNGVLLGELTSRMTDEVLDQSIDQCQDGCLIPLVARRPSVVAKRVWASRSCSLACQDAGGGAEGYRSTITTGESSSP